MIVDDEAYNCEVLTSMVASSGIHPDRIIVCISAKQALDKCKELKNKKLWLKLLLTDLSMPCIDGYKFIRKFRKLMSD